MADRDSDPSPTPGSRAGDDLQGNTLFGHPTGLFALFFAEMWERFSYYGMRALLVFYMIKGFLGFGDNEAYAIYGAYGALVYATPFIGGILADRLLGARRAVVIGGLLMAAGHLLMTVEHRTAFFCALALLICGNGFFKPNISTIVGSLYPQGSPKKDAGFVIFYMGINLGAAMSPVICGYVGETYGWHYGFGLATVGMLIGVAVFVAPTRLTQLLILIGAATTAGAMPFLQDSLLQLVVRLFLSAALLVAGLIAVAALGRGGVPRGAGAPPDPAALSRRLLGLVRTDWAVYLAIVLAVPIVALIVQRNAIAGWALVITGAWAFLFILFEAVFRSSKIDRERLFVTLILMFFSMLFWAFFEQAGSSVANFTDRNVRRVFAERTIGPADVGTTVTFRIPLDPSASALRKLPLLSQAQLGFQNGNPAMPMQIERAIRAEEQKKGKQTVDKIDQLVRAVARQDVLTITGLTYLRAAADQETVAWNVTDQDMGMEIGGAEIPASEFQAANPIFIIVFGLLFSMLWGFLGVRGLEPSTPIKFAFGLLQLGLGFGAFWYGAQTADSRGMVAVSWLLLGFLLQTTGELCLSPVGLSMVTSLSPRRIVSTVMGAWFLATAFSNYLAGMIAKLTGVGHEGATVQVIPVPLATVDLYGSVFGKIALAAIASAAVCFCLAPLLSRWMHADAENPEPE